MAELPGNIQRLHEIIRDCTLCPRNCHVDRTAPPGRSPASPVRSTAGRVGTCRIGAQARVASAGPHFGEEPVLVGHGGSGTIFLAGCNLGCVFCQNWDISHTDEGEPCTPQQIARTALALQRGGCENINFVTPTHVAFAIAEAVWRGRAAGLTVPIVYNCGGYEAVETLRLLEGLVDIYMPDFKYASAAAGARYSGVGDYPQRAEAALAEMYRQVGPLQLDSRSSAGSERPEPVEGRRVAGRGVLVRHLVMPADLARSREAIDIVARAAPACAINVMGQYRPAGQAQRFPELLALPDAGEVADLRRYAVSRGLMRAD